jgi:hypothetical protein
LLEPEINKDSNKTSDIAVQSEASDFEETEISEGIQNVLKINEIKKDIE